ncbi:MAG: type II toxin-antitoxin system HicB family antitoxin [Chloroflexi bacterium]|nr:type II toxin-antitoxin system HicB family antitoxin [Chloroflexota bacterium]
MRYTVILEPEPEGGYSVHCPALPGCANQGESIEEALENIGQGIQDSLTAWAEEGLAPPPDSADSLAEELDEVLAARAEEGLPLTIETREVEVAFESAPAAAAAPAPPDRVPVVLTVPDDPRGGSLKRGALRAFIRHAGMTPEEFLDYVGHEADLHDDER